MDKGHPKNFLNQVSRYDCIVRRFNTAKYIFLSKKVLPEVPYE